MFIASVPTTAQQLANDSRMCDQIFKMYYNHLAAKGYQGGYDDYMTRKYESDMHKMYVGALNGDNTADDFIEVLTDFFEYYKSHAPKVEPDEESKEWLRERGYLKGVVSTIHEK